MANIFTSLGSTVTLNDGVVMPMFGLGMYLIDAGDPTKTAVLTALNAGYRMIDTAEFYENEGGVQEAIEESGLKREDVFVVTKLWNHGKQNCYDSFAQSLRKLGTGYVDLYLIHHPIGGGVLESYDAMLDLKKQGLIRSVGVSNFDIHHLEALMKSGRPLPSVNQIELHMFRRQHHLVDFCRKHNITVMGYCPLARMKYQHSLIDRLAEKYNKSPAQILIRWSVEQGYITIPKSSQLDRIVSNAQVFDFEFTPNELHEVEDLKEIKTCMDGSFKPQESPWEG